MSAPSLYYACTQVSAKDDFFREEELAKGKLLRISEHVRDVRHCLQKRRIHGKCIPQHKVHEKSYEIEIKFDEKLIITEARCTCTSGLSGKCKHTAAVLDYVNNDDEAPSKTSLPQEWSQPTNFRQQYEKPMKIADLFPMPPSSSTARAISPISREIILCYPEIDCPLQTMVKLEQKYGRIENFPTSRELDANSPADASDAMHELLENSCECHFQEEEEDVKIPSLK